MEENYAFSRVRKVLDLLQITANQFEIEVGWSRGMIQKIKNGGSLTMESVKKVFTRYPQINPLWWFHDVGPILIDPKFLEKYNLEPNLKPNPKPNLPSEKSVKSGKQEGLNVPSRPPLVVTVDSSGRELISMVAARALARYVTSNHEQSFINELPAFSLPLPEFSSGTFRAFQSTSTSMEPTIYSGEWLIGLYLDNWPQNIRESQIYIVVTAETIFIRRVLNRIDTCNQLVLLSDNDIFPTEILDPKHIREIWHVKAKIGFNFQNIGYDIHRKISKLEAEIENIKSQLGRS